MESSVVHIDETKEKCLPTVHHPQDAPANLSRFKLITVLLALVVAIFMAASNENMVFTAMGGITKDLKASSDVTWVIASYLLLTTASQPLYGKLSDIFGRRACFITATLIFILGSIGCAVSNSLPMIAIFRGLDGVGSGGLYSLGYIVIGDLVPLKERGSIMGILQLTYGIAGLVGPVIGGILVENVSWRVVFYITIPMGILVLIGAWWIPSSVSTSNSSFKQQLSRVDFAGAITLVLGTILIILGCNWGGKEHPWGSWQVVTCLCGGMFLLIVFVIIETKASEPVIPFRIFQPNTICTVLISVSFGVVLFNFGTHLPLYLQNVQGYSATKSGFLLVSLFFGMPLTAAISGFISDHMKSPIPLMRLGTFLMCAGCLLGLLIRPEISMTEEVLISTLAGIGIGLNIQSVIVMAQASNSQSDMAVVTTLMRYAFAFGGTIGLTIHGSIFNNILIYQLKSTLPPSQQLNEFLASPSNLLENLKKLTDASNLVKLSLITSYKYFFISLIGFASIGFIASILLILPPSLQQPSKSNDDTNSTITTSEKTQL